MDGFEVLEHIDLMPRIIFTTAYGDYALKAFEVNAIDYLLKPYDKKRFSKAIQKVVDRSTKSNDELGGYCVSCSNRKSQKIIQNASFSVGRKIISVQQTTFCGSKLMRLYSIAHNTGIYLCNLSLNVSKESWIPPNLCACIVLHNCDKLNEHLDRDGEGDS